MSLAGDVRSFFSGVGSFIAAVDEDCALLRQALDGDASSVQGKLGDSPLVNIDADLSRMDAGMKRVSANMDAGPDSSLTLVRPHQLILHPRIFPNR